jgi:hypothetical protein
MRRVSACGKKCPQLRGASGTTGLRPLKKQETYDGFKMNRRYVEVFQLPPYWPELNATERIWNCRAGFELRASPGQLAYNEVMQYTPSNCRPALFGSD